MSASVTGYKGFDRDLKCRGMQFEVGKTYTEKSAKLCDRGFHFCTGALDCLSYYPAGAGSRYCRVVASGQIDGPGNDGDTKMAATILEIGPELTLTEMVREVVASYLAEAKETHTATTGDRANAATTGDGANAATTGDGANAATTGYGANAATTGDRANAATTGYGANAATTGDRANAATTGDGANAATTGDRANAATTGYGANAATTGDRANAATTGYGANAAVAGKHTIAAALGISGAARGALGCWIVVAERVDSCGINRGTIKTVRTAIVDGETIKADTYYSLVGGEFVERKDIAE